MEPILFRRSVRTASGLPQFISQRGDVGVSEGGDAMGILSLRMPLNVVLERLPRMLVSGEMLAFSLLLAGTMGMRGAIV